MSVSLTGNKPDGDDLYFYRTVVGFYGNGNVVLFVDLGYGGLTVAHMGSKT